MTKNIQKNNIWYKKWWVILLIFLGIYIAYQVFIFQIDKEKLVSENLEREGYEVISVYYSELNNQSIASINMKSLGNRNEQVWSALITLGVYYRNATAYFITILTPYGDCAYIFEGDILRNYFRTQDGEKLYYNGTEVTNMDYFSYISNKIDSVTKTCS